MIYGPSKTSSHAVPARQSSGIVQTACNLAFIAEHVRQDSGHPTMPFRTARQEDGVGLVDSPLSACIIDDSAL